jgi:hypothetical protein
MESWEGFAPVRSAALSEAAILKTIDLLTNKAGWSQRRHAAALEEAITTADFATLLGGTLERSMLGYYKSAPSPWRAYTRTGTVRDFRQTDVHKVQGNDLVLARVREKEEYPIAAMSDAVYHRQVFKYGRQFDISWEALVNDDLGAFANIAQRFASAAADSMAREVTGLYASVGGPDVLLFGAPIADVDGQNVTNLGALPLSIANIEATLQLMALQQDVNGRPLGIRGVHLVVAPGREIRARQILTSAWNQQIDTAGGANAVAPTFVMAPSANVLPQMGLQLHVDPWLPIIDSSGNNQGTWYLFADTGQGRAMELDFLQGHEAPEIVMKASNKQSIGGGTVSPLDGDFESDNVKYRVRAIFGGTRLDPRMAYAQVSAV